MKFFLNSLPLLKKLLLHIYFSIGNVVYWIYGLYNISFSYSLLDKTKVKFFPRGQIAKGIFFGGFERKELEIFQSLLKHGTILIDAGANIGLYSVIGSKLIGSTGRIYSFEPSKANFNLFMDNIKLNKIDNVYPINMGLGDKIGDKLILTQNLDSGDAEKYILRIEDKKDNLNYELNEIQLNEQILIDTLDNFQLINNIKKVDFIKLDVEGYEYYVLKGAENLLKNNPEIIILFECAEHLAERAETTQKDVFNFLYNLGFEIAAWNEQEKKWTTNIFEAMKAGQLIGGRNISTLLNYLSSENK